MNRSDDLLSKGIMISCDHLGIPHQTGKFVSDLPKTNVVLYEVTINVQLKRKALYTFSRSARFPDKPATTGREKRVYTPQRP